MLIYNTGEVHWDRFQAWPQSCDTDCPHKPQPLYLIANGSLSFEAPDESAAKFDQYVSDPAKPVPYRPRPVFDGDGNGWRTWLVMDQRFVDGRSDVLRYMSEPLQKPVRVSGAPEVNLYASTSGSDADRAVKLIDVFPGSLCPRVRRWAGTNLRSPWTFSAAAIATASNTLRPSSRTNHCSIASSLPTVNHVFEPGHRIMVQVQSSLFPLYDRNPQTFVPNIFDAKPADYQKATERIWHTPGWAGFISLPVCPNSRFGRKSGEPEGSGSPRSQYSWRIPFYLATASRKVSPFGVP